MNNSSLMSQTSLLSIQELEFFNISLPIISIIGLFINVAVIAVILTDRHMRQTTYASVYIVNLAVADILVLIVGVPLWIYQLISKNADDWSCPLTFGLSYVTSVVSVFTLAIISYDRYHCVMQPFNHDVGYHFALKVITVVWFVGFILSIPLFVGFKAAKHPVTLQISGFCVYTRYFREEVMVSHLIIVFLLITLSALFYLRLCKIARYQAFLIRKDMKTADQFRQMSLIQTNFTKACKKKKIMKGQKIMKATKTLGVILGAMVLCWIPFLVISIIDVFDTSLFSVFTLKLLGTITYINSILNPIIYTFMTRAFRQSLARRLYCFRKKLTKKSLTEIRKCVSEKGKQSVSV